MSDAIISILQDNNFAQNIGKNARKAVEKYRLSKYVDKMDKLYKELMTDIRDNK